MVNLNKMYDGVVNSPETYLTQNLTADATIIYVADSSVFGSLPNLAVIGTDQNAETILIKSKRSDGGLEVQRALEGPAKRWEKTTAIARNFTNYDYKQIKDNIEKLNIGKQNSLTAGSNIKITNGRISATDTKYNDTQIKKDIAELQNGQLSKASQIEAESGVDNAKYMTPQTTKQAIEKLSPKQDLTDYAKKTDIKLSRSATFIIANYDSSENSKAGADYVIQENEDTGRVIESFINKLPEYGGKILLTEGNFKSVITITLSGNILLEGYGNSTKIGYTRFDNSNNSIMNCSINSDKENSIIYASGSNNSIINCSITATNNNSTAVFSTCEKLSIINCSLECNNSGISLFLGNNNLVTNCRIISKGSTIDVNNSVKSSIVMGNQYVGKEIYNKGTNTIIANNVKLEV